MCVSLLKAIVVMFVKQHPNVTADRPELRHLRGISLPDRNLLLATLAEGQFNLGLTEVNVCVCVCVCVRRYPQPAP